MAYRVLQDGSIETDSITEALTLAQHMASQPPPGMSPAVRPAVRSALKPAMVSGVQKSWDEARKLAAKEGISVQDARIKLAKKKSK